MPVNSYSGKHLRYMSFSYTQIVANTQRGGERESSDELALLGEGGENLKVARLQVGKYGYTPWGFEWAAG